MNQRFHAHNSHRHFPSVNHPDVLVVAYQNHFLLLQARMRAHQESSLPYGSRILRKEVPSSLSGFLSSRQMFHVLWFYVFLGGTRSLYPKVPFPVQFLRTLLLLDLRFPFQASDIRHRFQRPVCSVRCVSGLLLPVRSDASTEDR